MRGRVAAHAGRRTPVSRQRFRRVRGARQRPRPGCAFVISSPSGGGKTTVMDRLRKRVPRLMRSVSATTRAPRHGERRTRAYRFLTREEFQLLRRTGALLEWATVHGASYGTPKAPVVRALARGRDVLLSIDVQGARKIRRVLGDQAVLVFLMPPSMAQLRQRLRGRRTDSPASIRRRLAAAKRELACASWYDYRIVNDRLEDTIKAVELIVQAHGARGS